MTADITFYEQKFRERGLALTVQRRVILAELLARRDHPTADQVFAAVVGRVPGLSRTTVYRVLETLVGLGMARKVLHADAAVRFDPNVARHHHLVCDVCGRLVDLDEAGLDALPLPAADLLGFTIRDYTINFTGICLDCREANSMENNQKGEHHAGTQRIQNTQQPQRRLRG